MEPDAETLRKLKAFATGEVTWAEANGVTFEEARAIADIGCDLAAQGRLLEAKVLFEGLVEMNPRDAASRAALGTVYQKLGQLDAAVAEYSAAIGLDPAQPVALANRGEIRLQQRDQGGVEDLIAAAKADPGGATTAGRRARALVEAIAAAGQKAAAAQAQQR